MATEAQRLIGISLTKIAQSRGVRGGISLHKNLLVATVLQKARYIFMEEAYHMVHSGSYRAMGTAESPPVLHVPTSNTYSSNIYSPTTEEVKEDNNLVAATPEEIGFSEPCEKCTQNQSEVSNVEKPPPRDRNRLKRRCTISDWETEEAILSILPKRSKTGSTADQEVTEVCDNTSVDDITQLSACISSEFCETGTSNTEHSEQSVVEIDRITSLVSIFSFTNFCSTDSDKLTRSVSTPDLCSSQAKETLQQRPVIAMTV